jgi:hypothetical protein
MRLVPALAPIHASTPNPRLDELGSIPLVRFDHRPIPAPNPKPPMAKVASAIPAWTEATRDRFQELGWDEFWAEHPAGAGRLVRLEASSYEDAVKAARAISLTTRPGLPDGDKQAQALLLLDDGSWYAASLGSIEQDLQGVYLLRMGSYPGFWRPKATSLVPELQAVVGGATMVDLRGKLGVPVQT